MTKQKRQDRYQIRFDQEVFVDLFSGGGGASWGIEDATAIPVFAAVNHDPDAIRMHMTNHKWTKHYQTDVWDVDPVEVCEGRHVGLLWASPDCKHFSKARGGKPVNKKIRSLSWVVLKWALDVRPRVLMMENVEEIQTWGPLTYVVRGGKKVLVPDPEHSGETFTAFIGMLTTGVPEDHPALEEACHYLHLSPGDPKRQRLIDGLGYDVEFKELVAADYGAPTTRKRFVLVARCDGKPIAWPERTHAPRNSEEVKSGKLPAWVPAADIIDWNLPGYSIFESKEEIKRKYGAKAQRPLAPNTLRRVIKGVDKFTIKSGDPFLIECNHSGGGHIRSIKDPVNTVTGKFTCGVIGEDAREPLPTVTSVDHNALCSAHVVKFKGQELGQHPLDTLNTITAQGLEYADCRAVLAKLDGATDLGHWDEIRKLLNEHCGYNLAEDEIILLIIRGVAHYIHDITLRMLTPRELYNAMGFPPDYAIEFDFLGNVYPKNKQVARCGNAVCPLMAKAMVRANLPEYCIVDVSTLAEFCRLVSAGL